MSVALRASAALIAGASVLAGCADNSLFPNGEFQTGALGPKVDPVCMSLASQIDGLRREGVADRIEKAAAKKYKMTPADLTKADQLTKANNDFQAKCSTVPKTASQTASAAGLNAPAQTSSSAPQSTPKQ